MKKVQDIFENDQNRFGNNIISGGRNIPSELEYGSAGGYLSQAKPENSSSLRISENVSPNKKLTVKDPYPQ